jgi:pyridoxal phosphate-dependent aminotransferase EpsN
MSAPRIYLSAPDVRESEERFVLDAIRSGWVAPVGPDLDAFEVEIAAATGVGHAVGLSSGTAALHLALVLLGVGKGDDVLVPTMTFVPTANVATYVGATPFFVDSERDSGCLSPELVEVALADRARRGRLPKVAMTVDLYGQCADYARLLPLFASYGVPVIEDAAEALGASRDGQRAGSFGAIAAMSFNGNKIVTASSGGALLCADEATAARTRKLATQAREDAPHYEHAETGYNYRLSNLLAAFGRAQLATLPERIARRAQIRDRYDEVLTTYEGIQLMAVPAGSEPNWWLTCITVDPTASGIDVERLRQSLEEDDIETRPMWKPMHLQPLFNGADAYLDGTSECLFSTGLCLPSGSGMTDADLDRVVERLVARLGRPGAAH